MRLSRLRADHSSIEDIITSLSTRETSVESPKMTENVTLDAALDAASSLPDSSIPQETAEAPQESQPAQPEAPQEPSVSQEETYTRIDPKTLSPELQALHKSLLRDYTKKTQELAKQRKEFEALRQQPSAPVETPTTPQKDVAQMTPEEFAQHVLEQARLQREVEAEQTRQDREAQLQEQAVSQLYSVDERLNPEVTDGFDKVLFNFVTANMDELSAQHIAEHGTIEGFDVTTNAEQLIEQFEAYQQQYFEKQAKVKTEQALAQAKKLAPLGGKQKAAPTSEATVSGFDEAFDKALSEAT